MNLLNLLKIIIGYKGHTKSVNRSFIRLKMLNFNKIGVTEEKRNPRLIISLTSYKERLKDIDFTLYSLLNQNLKPDKIVLWLDKEIFNEKNLPKTVSKFIKNGLEIKFCEDVKSYTKLIPALKEFPDSIVVTADDDIYYKKDWLEKLYNSYLKNPNDIHCHRAHRVSIDKDGNIVPYENWQKNLSGADVSALNFLTGVGGVLYPPNCFDNTVFDMESALALSPTADDVWFWLMAIKNNKKIRVVKNNDSTIFATNIFRQLGITKEKTLYSVNKQGKNDEQIKAVLAKFHEIKEKLVQA